MKMFKEWIGNLFAIEETKTSTIAFLSIIFGFSVLYFFTFKGLDIPSNTLTLLLFLFGSIIGGNGINAIKEVINNKNLKNIENDLLDSKQDTNAQG